MSTQPSRSETSDIRASMQRRPAGVGKIEKARDPRNALIRLLPAGDDDLAVREERRRAGGLAVHCAEERILLAGERE